MIVKIVGTKNTTLIVEWVDELGVHRGLAPTSIVIDNEVDDRLTSLIISYGIDWSFALEGKLGQVTVDRLAEELRKAGIWTLEDVRTKPKSVMGAIQSAYGLDFSVIIAAAEEYNK